jgi:hypothetical protein
MVLNKEYKLRLSLWNVLQTLDTFCLKTTQTSCTWR